MSMVAAGANKSVGSSRQQTPAARYSPGRRALSSRNVNSVWLGHTPTSGKKQSSDVVPVRAFSDVQSPFASPAVGWIQRAVLSGITPESNAVLQSPSVASPTPSTGDSPALEWKIATNTNTTRQSRLNMDDILVEQVTPVTPAAHHGTPTVSGSGGFDVPTRVDSTQSPCPAHPSECNVSYLVVEPDVQLPSGHSRFGGNQCFHPASLPRYSCTLVGVREVCKQDPLHPVAFPRSFSHFVIQLALPDFDLGRAKLVVAEKRFSEFVELDAQLRESMQSENLGYCTQHWAPKLPAKRLWPTRASVVAERQCGLQNYLDWVVTLEAEAPRRLLLEWLAPFL